PLDAFVHEGATQTLELFQGEEVCARQERHVLRHAIDTAEVAAVRHRNPEIGDFSSERIDHGPSVAHQGAGLLLQKTGAWNCRHRMDAEPPFLLAIDQGTTSTRAVLFDAALRPLASHAIELKQIYPANGWVEHDAEEIWQAVLA